MGQIKEIKGKIIFKHETEADWLSSSYIPSQGEKVLYDPDKTHDYTRVKYGDGEHMVKDLPFIGLARSGEGEGSAIIGTGSATGIRAIALGDNVIASGDFSHAEGTEHEGEGVITLLEASGAASHAEGVGTRATDIAAHAEGARTVASGISSHAEGVYSVASGYGAHAEGVKGENSVTKEVVYSIASGTASHAEGLSLAKGHYSHSEGVGTTNSATGEYSMSTAEGTGSHAEGAGVLAKGVASHAEGALTKANGKYSHAEGGRTVAEEEGAHAEGLYSVANGIASHAEGMQSVAQGEAAHVEGKENIAYTLATHAEGIEVKAGCRGYYYDAVSFNTTAGTAYFHLCQNQVADSSQIRVYEEYPTMIFDESKEVDIAWDIDIGTKLNVINKSKYYQCEVVENCADGFICLKVPFTSIITQLPENMDLDDFSITNPRQPEIGNAEIKKATHAEGWLNVSAGDASHAEGHLTEALGDYAHSEGWQSIAWDHAAHSEGVVTQALQKGAHAEGWEAIADGIAAHSEGYATKAEGNYAHAEGYSTVAGVKGEDTATAHAEGYQSKALAHSSHAEGRSTQATAYGAHSEGRETIASALHAHAEGYKTKATGQESHAEGNGTIASGLNSHAQGAGSKSYGRYSHTEGYQNVTGTEGATNNATSQAQHAEGYQTQATGNYAHSEGYQTKALHTITHAEGQKSEAHGDSAHAEGFRTKAYGNRSHVEGSKNQTGKPTYDANGQLVSNAEGAHAEGKENFAYGVASHAEGWKTTAISNYTHTEGYNTVAGVEGEDTPTAHAEGYNTKATGHSSHAEGRETLASGYASHAEGRETLASGYASHAEGYNTKASGKRSHAEGISTIARGEGSHAGGFNTIASANNQTAIGQYNQENNNALFIVGNGESDKKRNNAFEVSRDGEIFYGKTQSPISTVFSNALKGNKIGERMLEINDISPVEHEMSVKVKSNSKNLIPFPYTHGGAGTKRESNGVTFIVRKDGSVSATGTATAFASFYLTETNIFEVGKTYSCNRDSNIFIAYRDEEKDETQYITFLGHSFTWEEHWTFLRIYLQVNPNIKIDKPIYPIIVEGNTPPSAYQSYINDLSTVKINRYSKNLFNDIAFYNDNGFTYNETEKAWEGTQKFVDIFTNNAGLPGRFTIQTEARLKKAGAKALYFLVSYTDGTKNYSIGDDLNLTMSKYSFTTDEEKVVDKITWAYNSDGKYYVRNTMISYTDTAIDYEPGATVTDLSVDKNGMGHGIYSTYPNTILLADKHGVIIECEYNRDINKAFAELYEAIMAKI